LVITISPLYTYLSFSNTGTVEFLVDKDGNHFFVEVNPRVQVEHTITEEITGIDIVQSQIMIASRKTLDGIGLTQDSIKEPTSYPMQCRVVS
jgi:pyruvate carboxylase